MWNPVLYALLNLQLRAAFLQLVPQCIKHSLTCTYCSKSNARVSGRSDARRMFLEESRLLGSVLRGPYGQGQRKEKEGGDKLCFNCFPGSSGSIEFSSSEQQHQSVSVGGKGKKREDQPLVKNLGNILNMYL